MSNEVKQRRRAAASPNGEAKEEPTRKGGKPEAQGCGGTPAERLEPAHFCRDPRTLLCLLSMSACLASVWFAFQQSITFDDVEKRYQLLEMKTLELQALKDKVGLLSEKFEHSQHIMEQLKNHQISESIENLQQDITNIRAWTETLTNQSKRTEHNVTLLLQTIGKTEQSSSSVAVDVSGKIATVKTDIRRISGLGSDVETLIDSVKELEGKLEKVVKKTEQNIGHLLASNIDRITELKSSVRRNSERIDMIKGRYSGFLADFRKQSDMLLNLQSDRVKVLKTLNFVNDLKPKVSNMKNDFALLSPIAHDLTLRIGRLASDLLQREGEIALLNEKVFHLSKVTMEVGDMKDKITGLSENN